MTLLTSPRQAPDAESLLVTLSESEHRETAALARELAATPPGLVDDPQWLAAARRMSCRLPVRVREAARLYKHDPGRDGILIVAGLPVEEERLPLTPSKAESVERTATLPAAVAVLMSMQIGEIAAYRAEKSGALVQNVVPVPGQEESQSNAGSTPLELHVENAFHPRRPDYVGLLCLRGDRNTNAGTLVSSIRRALELLPADVVGVLQAERFSTAPPPSFHGGASAPAHAVLTGSAADPDVVVDFHATTANDDEAKVALEHLRTAFLEAARTLVLRPGEMAFVDNRLAVHGRTAYTPRYDGHDRWLHRTFVHLDHRRTRGHRTGDGDVLD
ncbi:TauD/TfdA family dioxygenase [Streptomyces sp. NPDC000931]|uniref:TauD/TfdA family dioxygenase n=1 Tax=Streptomyces sp. NPDC000931 TaxID=3154372 RepID=UPI00332FE249